MTQPDKQNGWNFWIDRGGTFTDIIAINPDGQLISHKLLSENPLHYPDAALQGIRDLMGLCAHAHIPAHLLESVRMGTTIATNALLERRGAKTGLIISRGFHDALIIGYQNRPDIFSLQIKRQAMLYNAVYEVDERVTAQGDVLTAPDIDALENGLRIMLSQGIESIAIACIHGYQFPAHELLIAQCARNIGFKQVYCSHVTSPLIKLISRADTTVVDAYLSPILQRYVNGIYKQIGSASLMFMQSSGGLTSADHFHGKDAILSGPAGGIIGMAHIAEQAGFNKVIGFDMGGTSTDVSHYAGDYERDFETNIAGVRLRTPTMRIHTVAAGGGSILKFDGERFQVGPESAGANPGPACYRNDGPLTVTDCNVMLGRLQPDWFPSVFGANADQGLDYDVVVQAFDSLTRSINETLETQHSSSDIAEGFLAIAVDNMAAAIKKISIERGYDVGDYTLCSFGGAGGQHACLVAEALGINQVLIHPQAGVLSALGMGLAKPHIILELAIEQALTAELINKIETQFINLEESAQNQLINQGFSHCRYSNTRRCHIHYQDSDTQLLIEYTSLNELRDAFSQAHQRRFGFISEHTQIIIAALQIEMVAHLHILSLDQTVDKQINFPDVPETSTVTTTMGGKRHNTPIYLRQNLQTDNHLPGPALIIEANSTIVVEPGWKTTVLPGNELLLYRDSNNASTAITHKNTLAETEIDPILLEVFNNRFMAVAEQMGTVLQSTARSVNIKERLDFSCALFDNNGHLLANAPHIPVHIGSMSDTICAVISEYGDKIKAGDIYLSNNPYNGGTHLPDITVIRPVFIENHLTAYVAARGHHADIGGITPGSMPAYSKDINEEGIVIDNELIVEFGIFKEQEIRQWLSASPWPARNIDQNIADFKAQIAACECGAQEIIAICGHYSRHVVLDYMGYIQDYAARAVSRVLKKIEGGQYRYIMDDGSLVQVSIQITSDKQPKAIIDFTGSSPTHPGNLNAPHSVCKAAVLYVFRCLIDEDIPLNAGFLRPMEIIIPKNSILNPSYPAAVVAGNVETSQIIVDTLFGALAVQAAAQGTCNNFTFGDDQHQYYETLCGGTGAGKDYNGCDAIHSHMTNSRLTDPEILEQRFPVLLESFQIREHSGGKGHYHGGNGVKRRIRFLKPMTASIISGQRKTRPFGLNGGEAGQPGINTIERTTGQKQTLSGCDQIEMESGDVFIIETPGGGGYGPPD